MKDSSREYLTMLAHLFLRNGKITEANTILEGLAVLFPGDHWVHRTLAYTYLIQKKYQDCLSQIDRLSASQLEHPERVIQVRALWELGRHQEARKLLSDMQGRLRD